MNEQDFFRYITRFLRTMHQIDLYSFPKDVQVFANSVSCAWIDLCYRLELEKKDG